MNLLSSSENYIGWIALENCKDYFLAVGIIGKNKQPVIRDGNERKVFRLFLNSIDSLNNIVDYLYFDKFYRQFNSFKCYKDELLSRHHILLEINEIANAYKHCKRGIDKKGLFCVYEERLHAKNIRFAHLILQEAFNFWINYYQKDGKINLFADAPMKISHKKAVAK